MEKCNGQDEAPPLCMAVQLFDIDSVKPFVQTCATKRIPLGEKGTPGGFLGNGALFLG